MVYCVMCVEVGNDGVYFILLVKCQWSADSSLNRSAFVPFAS